MLLPPLSGWIPWYSRRPWITYTPNTSGGTCAIAFSSADKTQPNGSSAACFYPEPSSRHGQSQSSVYNHWFHRHYMPEGGLGPDTSVRSEADEHRSNLKRNASKITRSMSEVFAHLTYGTKSLEEAKQLLKKLQCNTNPWHHGNYSRCLHYLHYF